MKFTKEYPIDPLRDRSKGLWIYCLHPKWTDKNESQRIIVDKCMSIVFSMLKDQYVINVSVWGSDDKDLFEEFELTSKSSILIIVKDNEIISKTDCFEQEAFEDYFQASLKKIKSRTPTKSTIEQVSTEPQVVVDSKKQKRFGLFG